MEKFLTPFVHRIIAATLIFIFTLIYFIDASSLENQQDTLMVQPVLWIMIILYPIIIWQEWRAEKKRKVEKQKTAEEEEDADEDTSIRLSKKVFLFMIFTFIYLILMNYIGFIISTIVYMPALMWVLGTKSKKMLIILPIVTAMVLFFLFNNLLGIPLPQGVLLEGVL